MVSSRGPVNVAPSLQEAKPTRRRIAVLGETFPPDSGGVSAGHFSLATLLATRHDVRLFAFEDPRPSSDSITRAIAGRIAHRAFARAASAFVARYDPSGESPLSQRIAATIPAVRRLNAPIAKFKPEIIFVPDFCAPALGLKKPRGAKVIWVAHHNYKRFENNPMFRVPGWYDTILAHRLERRALRKCDYAVFPSAYMEKVFRATLDPRMPGSIIHNNVDLLQMKQFDRARIRGDLGLEPHTCLVYLPSAGTSAKGERYVFELVRRVTSLVPDVRFFISGPIDRRLGFELSDAIASGRVLAPGKLPHDKNLEMVSAADVAISPALVENFSCALLEAQALGVPCVAFNVGGNPELISDGESGFVVPYLDVDRLIDRASVLLRDSAMRGAMGKAGTLRAQEICDPEKLLSQYEQVIGTLMTTGTQ